MSDWYQVCDLEEIGRDSGVCALVNGRQVAVFKVGAQNKLFALDNYDPQARAHVISRGLIGSSGDSLFVASPMYKDRYCLETGQLLSADSGRKLDTFPTRVVEGCIQILC